MFFFGCPIFLEFMNVSQEAPTLCVLPPPFNFDKFLVFWKSDFVVSRAVHTLRFDYSVQQCSAGKGPFMASKAKNMS